MARWSLMQHPSRWAMRFMRGWRVDACRHGLLRRNSRRVKLQRVSKQGRSVRRAMLRCLGWLAPVLAGSISVACAAGAPLPTESHVPGGVLTFPIKSAADDIPVVTLGGQRAMVL